MNNTSDFIIEDNVLWKYDGLGGDVVIPDGITRINGQAFCILPLGCKPIHLTIPDSVVEIVPGAFYSCSKLASITIPTSVRVLEKGTFYLCEILKITIAKSSHNHNPKAYGLIWEALVDTQCKLYLMATYLKNHFEIVKETESIAKRIKANKNKLVDLAIAEDDGAIITALFSLFKKIPIADLNKYEENAKNTLSCKAVIIEYKNTHYTPKMQERHDVVERNKELCTKDLTFADWKKRYTLEETAENTYIIKGYKGSERMIVVPQEIKGKRITAVAKYAFSPNGPRMTAERKEALEKIETIVLPEGISHIEEGAFSGCVSLQAITIPKSVYYLGDSAFCGCNNLTSVEIEGGISIIGESCFEDCTRLTQIVVSDGVTAIGKNSFKNCEKLASISIPESIVCIAESAFCNCNNLTTVSTFRGDETSSAFFLDSRIYAVKNSIDRYAFQKCTSLSVVVIPEGVGAISDSAFRGCSQLTSLTIPKSVTSIKSEALGSCKKVVIHAPAGSFAEKYAKKNKIPFKEE